MALETAVTVGVGQPQKLDKARFLSNVNFATINPLKSLKTAKEIFGKT
jgi:hypothetical protein